jgi:hypothetical protein
VEIRGSASVAASAPGDPGPISNFSVLDEIQGFLANGSPARLPKWTSATALFTLKPAA